MAKEILFKFESEDLFNEFIEEIIKPTLAKQAEQSDTVIKKLEYDWENNIANISNIDENKEA